MCSAITVMKVSLKKRAQEEFVEFRSARKWQASTILVLDPVEILRNKWKESMNFDRVFCIFVFSFDRE